MTIRINTLKWLVAATLGATSVVAVAQAQPTPVAPAKPPAPAAAKAAGFIDLKHDGAYVAYFEVKWLERDDKGHDAEKKWASGDKPAGFKTRITLPPSAHSINVKATEYTGLVWDPKKVALDVKMPSAPNKCFRIHGTTLAPKSDNKC